MKILLMGPQGCGKGTIGEKLSVFYKIPLISNGEMLRGMPKDHPRYEEVQEIMKRGELAPQDLLADLLRSRVSDLDCVNGYVQDGWGRKMIDLYYFDPGYDKVVLLTIPAETSIFRLANRRTCRKCGKVFNIVTVPPKVAGQCDDCGGELYQRDDDTEEAIKKRLEIYHTDTQGVLELFKKQGKLIEVNAEPEPGEVFKCVLEKLEQN